MWIMTKNRVKESDLYEPVRRWAEKSFSCFKTGINIGTEHGRVDILCMRQTPGDLSSQTDVICIEVKKGAQPFLNSLGQAAGYAIYGDFTYLADYRPNSPFSEEEILLAHQLGVGLIRIYGPRKIRLVSSAEQCVPVENFKLRIADQLGYVRCTICSTFFPRGESVRRGFDWSLLQRHLDNRVLMKKGVEKGKGIVFWPDDASKNDLTHKKRHKDGRLYNRRFACNTCAQIFLNN